MQPRVTVFWCRFLLVHQEFILFPEQQIDAIFYTHSLTPGRWPTTQFSFDTPPGEPQVTSEGLRPTGLPSADASTWARLAANVSVPPTLAPDQVG